MQPSSLERTPVRVTFLAVCYKDQNEQRRHDLIVANAPVYMYELSLFSRSPWQSTRRLPPHTAP